MIRPTCKDCRYWQEEFVRGDVPHSSSCRVSHIYEFERYEDDWCGEHKPIRAEKPDGMSNHTWNEAQRETEQAFAEYQEEDLKDDS